MNEFKLCVQNVANGIVEQSRNTIEHENMSNDKMNISELEAWIQFTFLTKTIHDWVFALVEQANRSPLLKTHFRTFALAFVRHFASEVFKQFLSLEPSVTDMSEVGNFLTGPYGQVELMKTLHVDSEPRAKRLLGALIAEYERLSKPVEPMRTKRKLSDSHSTVELAHENLRRRLF
jgi:hypothetical protein